MNVSQRRTAFSPRTMLMMVGTLALAAGNSFGLFRSHQRAIAAPPDVTQSDLTNASSIPDKPDQMTAEQSALVKRLWERDGEFDPRSLEMIRSWVRRVDPRAQLAAEKDASTALSGPRMFGPPTVSIPVAYDQRHRVPYRLTTTGRGGGVESRVFIDNATDLEAMIDSRFDQEIRAERWPDNERTMARNTVMMNDYVAETVRLEFSRRAFEWSAGYGFAASIAIVDSIEDAGQRRIVRGRSRVFPLGDSYTSGESPPNHDSTFVIEFDGELVARKAVFVLSRLRATNALSGNHKLLAPEYDRITRIEIDTSGTYTPTDAPSVAKQGRYKLFVQNGVEVEQIYRDDTFSFVAISSKLNQGDLRQRSIPKRELYLGNKR